MDAFLTSAGLVALGEIGDKTQLLAILLAARFGQPVPIIAGIFAATILNHTIASFFGVALSHWLAGPWFQAAVGASFIAMALWALIPDKMEESQSRTGRGVFLTTLVSFFLVEIGDKTQIVTMLLAARFQDILLVAAGTTTGMLIADVPAVIFGERAARLLPLAVMRRIAAALFGALGVWILLGMIWR